MPGIERRGAPPWRARRAVLAAALAAVSAAMLVGCAALAPRPPQVALASIDRIGLDGRGAEVDVTLALRNRNAYALRIDALQATLAIDGAPLAHGSSRAAVELPASGDAELAMTVSLDAGAALRLLPLLARQARVPYVIDGSAVVGGVALPFHASGSAPLPH